MRRVRASLTFDPSPDRDCLAPRLTLLRRFLDRFGLEENGEVVRPDGAWWIEREEGGPAEVFVPDIGSYVGVVRDILSGLAPEMIIRGYVVQNETGPTRRRVWLSLGYDLEDGEWFYRFPGDGDDSDLDRPDPGEREG